MFERSIDINGLRSLEIFFVGLCIVAVTTSNTAAQSDWSHLLPPPVIVGNLDRMNVVRPEVQRAGHVSAIQEVSNDRKLPVWQPPVPMAAPHLTIEAPRPIPARRGEIESHNYVLQDSDYDVHSSISHNGTGLNHLPELPGVENDPSAIGPGRLGLGAHWVVPHPPARPPIPGATVAPRWKTPYSYGHFGAQGKRHWTRQHGYRDRYLQWTLR